MGSSSVVRIRSGETLAVRTGVLRGAGPQGPMGPAGPKGSTGPTGPTGPQPTVTQQRSHLITTAAVAIGGDGLWYDLAMPLDTSSTEPNDLLATPVDPYGFQFKDNSSAYYGYVRVRFELRSGSDIGGVAGGSRRVRIIDAATSASPTPTVMFEGSVAAAPSEPTIVVFPVTFTNVDTSKKYKVQAYSDDSAGISVTNRSLRMFRINAGPPGPQGPQGLVGQTGPQGPQGVAGSAGTGYTTSDALIGGADSTVDPGGVWGATTDQGVPYLTGSQKPSLPYALKALAWNLENRVVARYTAATQRSSKRATRYAGEVTYLDDNGNLQHREKNGSDLDIARVIRSSSTPPSGSGQAAPGVLWIQI